MPFIGGERVGGGSGKTVGGRSSTTLSLGLAEFAPPGRYASRCSASPVLILCTFRAESAQEIDDQAYRQNQAQPAAADDGTAKVKPTAAEQEKLNN
jgi:hypothetical protein